MYPSHRGRDRHLGMDHCFGQSITTPRATSAQLRIFFGSDYVQTPLHAECLQCIDTCFKGGRRVVQDVW